MKRSNMLIHKRFFTTAIGSVRIEIPKVKKKKSSETADVFMHIKLEFEEEGSFRDINEATFASIIKSAVKTLHGEIGASNQVDILKYEEIEKEALLKVNQNFYVQLWSALTLLSNYQGHRCAVRVSQVSLEP